MSRTRKHLAHNSFDSVWELTEFLSSAEGEQISSQWADRATSDAPGRDEWTASRDYAHALELAREGWPEGREQMTDAVETLTPYVQAAIRAPSETLSVAGYAPNIPAYVSGSPACMFSMDGDDTAGRAPIVRFLVNIGASHFIDASALFNQGAALCAAVDYLEACGQSCEVRLVCRQESDKCTFDTYVTIKRAGEPIEHDRMDFFLGNASVLRRFIFRLNELDGKSFNGLQHGRGRPVDVTPEPAQVYLPVANQHSFNDYCRTPQKALRYVMRHIEKAMAPEQFQRVGEDLEAAMTALGEAA